MKIYWQVMNILQQAKQKNQKVLIHCYHGSDRTGASVAMYRIIFEDWTIEAAKARNETWWLWLSPHLEKY